MSISAYSIIVSVLYYNICLIAIALLRRSGLIRAKYVSALLLYLTLLAALRLVTPVDLKYALVIRSYRVLPALERALTAPLLGPVSIGQLILMLWGAGTLFFLVRDLIKQLRYHREVRRMLSVEDEQIARIAAEYPGRYSIKISPGIALPFVAGFFRPVIYLPAIALSDEEWRNIFRHETQHIRSHDEWKKLFFRLVRALFWWNPLARLSEEDISLLIELQCDERVAGSGDMDMQESYLRTMMALMRHYIDAKEPAMASPMIGSQTQMEIRFEALLAPVTRRSVRMRRVVPPVLLALFLASYLMIWQPAGFPDEEELLSAPVGHETLDLSSGIKNAGDKFILYDEGEYKLYIDGAYAFCLDEAMLETPDFSNLPIIYKGE